MRKLLSISLSDLIVIISFLFSYSSIYAVDTVTVPIKQFGYGVMSGACISPDGSQFLTGSLDCRVHLWDANTGALIRTFSGHKDDIRYVSFSPDGSKFLSASLDATVKLWNVSTGE
jgi:WD40 repeat protein